MAILNHKVRKSAKIIVCRLVLGTKDYQIPSKSAKVRSMREGYENRDGRFIIHDINLFGTTLC